MCALACSTAHDWTVRRRNHFCLLWLIYFQTHKKAKVESVLIFLTRKTHTYKVNDQCFNPTTVVRWEKVDILGFEETYSNGGLVLIWNCMVVCVYSRVRNKHMGYVYQFLIKNQKNKNNHNALIDVKMNQNSDVKFSIPGAKYVYYRP